MPVSFPWSLGINKGTPSPKFGITEDNGKESGKIACWKLAKGASLQPRRKVLI